jgi:hypothetical protein
MRNVVHLRHEQDVPAQGAALYFETGSTSGVQASHAKRLRMQLAALGTVQTIVDVDIPGFRLHPLKGELRCWFWPSPGLRRQGRVSSAVQRREGQFRWPLTPVVLSIDSALFGAAPQKKTAGDMPNLQLKASM